MELLIIFLLVLPGCSTHICIDELNAASNLFPFLQGYYDYFHSKLHKNKKACHLDRIVFKCCKRHMEQVYGEGRFFWRQNRNKFYKQTYSSFFCSKCGEIKYIATYLPGD